MPLTPASIRPRRCRRGERRDRVSAARGRDCASIRPRRCRRGERRRKVGLIVVDYLASIRPRRCRRGELIGLRSHRVYLSGFNSASTLSSRRTSRLHDAHSTSRPGFNSASTLSSRRTLGWGVNAGSTDQLQFGLDAVVEENANCAPPRCGGGRRFNSASTLSSRRTPLGRPPEAGRFVASIRPRRCRRGERRRRSSGRSSAVALQFGLDAVVEENAAGGGEGR